MHISQVNMSCGILKDQRSCQAHTISTLSSQDLPLLPLDILSFQSGQWAEGEVYIFSTETHICTKQEVYNYGVQHGRYAALNVIKTHTAHDASQDLRGTCKNKWNSDLVPGPWRATQIAPVLIVESAIPMYGNFQTYHVGVGDFCDNPRFLPTDVGRNLGLPQKIPTPDYGSRIHVLIFALEFHLVFGLMKSMCKAHLSSDG